MMSERKRKCGLKGKIEADNGCVWGKGGECGEGGKQ